MAGSRPVGIVFGSGLGSLVLFLALGYTAFRSVTLSPVVVVVVSSLNQSDPCRLAFTVLSLVTVAHGIVPLVVAAACVGIIIGIVTPDRRRDPPARDHHRPAEQGLFLALVLLVVWSTVLEMGLSSAGQSWHPLGFGRRLPLFGAVGLLLAPAPT